MDAVHLHRLTRRGGGRKKWFTASGGVINVTGRPQLFFVCFLFVSIPFAFELKIILILYYS
jgi:hypothetical protein